MRYKKIVVALLLFHVLDAITTIIFVNYMFGVEGNPITRWYMNYFGTVSGVLIKLVTIDVLLFMFLYFLSKHVDDWKTDCKNVVDRFCLKLLKRVSLLQLVFVGQVAVVFWNVSIIMFGV